MKTLVAASNGMAAAVPDHVRAGEERREWIEMLRRMDPADYGTAEGNLLWCNDGTVVVDLLVTEGGRQICRVRRGLIKRLLEALAQIQPKRFAGAHITAIVPPRHLSTGRTHISEFASPSYTLVQLEPILEHAEKVRRHPSQQTLDAVLEA